MDIAWDKPYYVFLFLLIAVVIGLLWQLQNWRRRVRKQYADAPLQEEVFGRELPSLVNLKSVFLILSLIFVVIAVMGPLWGEEEQRLKREGIDLVFALDLSNSMNAEDVAPSRLAKAKNLILKYTETLGGDRIGLVVFAGEAYGVSPLTNDYVAINSFVESFDTNLLWNQGTNFASAIEESLRILGDTPDTSKAIILISDGEDHENGINDQIQLANEYHVDIFSLGVGESVPVPIPMVSIEGWDEGYKEDDNGNTVLTSYHGETLRSIAQKSGGAYIKIEGLDITLDKLQNAVNTLEKKSQSELASFNKKHQYQWFLGVGILFFFIYTLTPDKSFINR